MWNNYGYDYNNSWIGAGNIPPVVPYGGGSYGPPSYGISLVDPGPPPRDSSARTLDGELTKNRGASCEWVL